LAGKGRGGSVPTYDLVHSTYVFLLTRATKVGKIVNPAVGKKKHKKLNKHTYVYYMSVCLTPVSCQQKINAGKIQRNIKS
jgi:hypothetical protein